MNLQSENKSSNAALQKLKQSTAESMQTIRETPYQQVVYAIPKEDWKAFLSLLEAASTFQPELYRKISEIATKKETESFINSIWNGVTEWAEEYQAKMLKEVGTSVQKMEVIQRESLELLSQDGKTRGRFFSDLRQEVNGQIGEMENLLSMMKKWILWTLLANVGLTSVLSTVISLLMN